MSNYGIQAVPFQRLAKNGIKLQKERDIPTKTDGWIPENDGPWKR